MLTVEHGTRSGWVAHNKRGEAACSECVDAQELWYEEQEILRDARKIEFRRRAAVVLDTYEQESRDKDLVMTRDHYPDDPAYEERDRREISVPQDLWVFPDHTVQDIIEYADKMDEAGFESGASVLRNCAYLMADLRGRIPEPPFGSLIKALTPTGTRMQLVRSEQTAVNDQVWSDGYGHQYAWGDLINPVVVERNRA